MAHRFDTPGQSRLFLAIRLPETVKKELAEAMGTLREHKELSFTRTDNLHITVHFYGNVEDEALPTLLNSIKNGLEVVKTFTLKLDQVILYPPRHPRMIWATFLQNTQFEILAGKFQDLAANGKHSGDTKEQKPHITCARLRHSRKVNYLMPLIESHTILVDHIELWKSVARDGGVKYESIASYPLAK